MWRIRKRYDNEFGVWKHRSPKDGFIWQKQTFGICISGNGNNRKIVLPCVLLLLRYEVLDSHRILDRLADYCVLV